MERGVRSTAVKFSITVHLHAEVKCHLQKVVTCTSNEGWQMALSHHRDLKGQFCMYAGSSLFVNLWNISNVCSVNMSESFKILYQAFH